MRAKHVTKALALASALAALLSPRPVRACACGCGIFEVGTSSMFPSGSGGTFFFEYDFMDQNRNFSGGSSAPAEDNPDKEIRTHFMRAGIQYMFDRRWGIQAEVPAWNRTFRTTDEQGNIVSFRHSDLGDIRIKGIYTGFSPDLTTGVTFGLKLPTGDYTYPNFDRDTEIGTGSTDLLLGAFHRDSLTKDNRWTWFAQAQWDQPFTTRGGYRPGTEIDAAGGIYYGGWSPGSARVSPVLNVVGSVRSRDSGGAADPDNSGYERVLVAPGIEVHAGPLMVYGDVEFNVYAHVNGNQLLARQVFKLIAGTTF